MKILDGTQLAGFIKERQAKQVRSLKSSLQPKLAIIQCVDDPTINLYVSLKKRYGSDIDVAVDSYNETAQTVENRINELNADDSVHGIIVQLPLPKEIDQQRILNLVSNTKDVDGLAESSDFDPATPTAISWLLAGYNVDLRGKQIAIVGQGALVGKPLAAMFEASGHKVVRVTRNTENMADLLKNSEVIVTGTGSPGLIKTDMIQPQAVVVDAGVAVEKGTTKGDLDEAVYTRDDLTITPKKGGVGPLTVCALFENVIKAASLSL